MKEVPITFIDPGGGMKMPRLDLRSSKEHDELLHMILRGRDGQGATSPPPYTEDEGVILAAIETVFGRVSLCWGSRSRGADGHSLILRGSEGTGTTFYACTRALALCEAALALKGAQSKALIQRSQDVDVGFYWFAPQPFVPITEWEVHDQRGLVHGERGVFFFATAEPFPIFVFEVEGRLVAAGVGQPLDWPREAAVGGLEGHIDVVALSSLPGELGPRIEPPASWCAATNPERLLQADGWASKPRSSSRPRETTVVTDAWTGEPCLLDDTAEGSGAV